MKKNILITSIMLWGLNAFAIDLPQIQKPSELEVGEFAEGTLTALSANDMKEYLPWANNAKKLLEDALRDSKRLPLLERKNFLENEIRSVVRESAPKKYQMLMRFALNRGLLLSDIISKESNQNDTGVIQNELSVLVTTIKTSFEFYESDLEFQKRVSMGINSIVIPQADLGFKLAQRMFNLAPSVMDATAQYQFMKKTFEILSWDLLQDSESKKYAEEIVDIYKVTSKMPTDVKNDEEAIKHVRSLNYLKNKLKVEERIFEKTPTGVEYLVKEKLRKEAEKKIKDEALLFARFKTGDCGLEGTMLERAQDCLRVENMNKNLNLESFTDYKYRVNFKKTGECHDCHESFYYFPKLKVIIEYKNVEKGVYLSAVNACSGKNKFGFKWRLPSPDEIEHVAEQDEYLLGLTRKGDYDRHEGFRSYFWTSVVDSSFPNFRSLISVAILPKYGKAEIRENRIVDNTYVEEYFCVGEVKE